MFRIILGGVIIVLALGSLAWVALWKPPAERSTKIKVEAGRIPPPPPEKPATGPARKVDEPGTPIERPPTVPKVLSPAAAAADDGPSPAQRLPHIPRDLRGGRTSMDPDEILPALEQAIRENDIRKSRDLAQELIAAIREGKLDRDRGLEGIMSLLRGTVDTNNLRGIVAQLGYLQDPKLAEFFRDQYWATQDVNVRQAYISALRNGAGEESLPFLRQVLQTETQQRLRNHSLFILSRIASEEAMNILEETARNGSGVDQHTALQLISNRKDPKHVSLFEDILAQPNESKLHQTAVRGLQQVGTTASLPILQRIVDDPNSGDYLRNLARIAIREINRRGQ